MNLISLEEHFFFTYNKTKDAQDMFQKSYQLYSLFWGLNLGLVQTEDVKQAKTAKIDFISDNPEPKVKGSVSIFEKLSNLVQKAINCCKE